MEKLKSELGRDRDEHVRFGRRVWLRTLYGLALTFVLSTQLLESYIRAGANAGLAPRVAGMSESRLY